MSPGKRVSVYMTINAIYKTIIFDCDGVVLNSNKIKTSAFYAVASRHYGPSAAKLLVDYHVENGGVSRYKKFEWLLKSLKIFEDVSSTVRNLSQEYSEEVYLGLQQCEIAPDLKAFREISRSRWLIVSGGDQDELRKVFNERNIIDYFDGGVFGSPDAKEEILKREFEKGNAVKPALFIGDSKYDYIASLSAKIDFVFLNRWTEFSGWCGYCSKHSISVVSTLEELSSRIYDS